MGQERELEAGNRGSGLNGLVFSAGDNAIISESNVEPLVQVDGLESSPKSETDFIPLDDVDKSGVPLPSLGCSHGLDEDLVADQHTGPFLRQTRDRKASKRINFSPRTERENTDKWKGRRYSILAFGISNFSRSWLYTR